MLIFVIATDVLLVLLVIFVFRRRNRLSYAVYDENKLQVSQKFASKDEALEARQRLARTHGGYLGVKDTRQRS